MVLSLQGCRNWKLKHQVHPTSISYRKVMPKRASGFLNITKLIWVSADLNSAERSAGEWGWPHLELPRSLLSLYHMQRLLIVWQPLCSVHWLLAVPSEAFTNCFLCWWCSSRKCLPVVVRFTTLGKAANRQTQGTYSDAFGSSPWLSRSFYTFRAWDRRVPLNIRNGEWSKTPGRKCQTIYWSQSASDSRWNSLPSALTLLNVRVFVRQLPIGKLCWKQK